MAMNTHQVAQATKQTADDQTAAKENQKKQSKSATDLVMDAFQGHANKLAAQLGKSIDPQKWLATVVNAIASNPDLVRALIESPRTVIACAYQAAELGFEPNTPLGLCYIIPRHAKDKVASEKAGQDVWKWQATFQLGYKGVLTLAYRSGEISYVDVEAVYEKDHFRYQLGTSHLLEHIPYMGADRGKVTHYYAVVELKNGVGKPLFKVWGYDQVMQHAIAFSSSYNKQYKKFFGPWGTNFDSMAEKTVLLDCLNLAPKSTQMSSALANDGTVKSIPLSGEVTNILSAPNEIFNSEEAQQLGADQPAQLENRESVPTGETAEAVAERLKLKKGSDLQPQPVRIKKDGQMSPDDVI